jgi:predicted AAA+ superfamily ATPase
MAYQRPQVAKLTSRIQEKRKLIQVLQGPRQTGKTTIARQVAEKMAVPFIMESADQPGLVGDSWIYHQWERARRLIGGKETKVLLILDEVQKISGWSSVVKQLWDEDTNAERNIYVILLGSSPLLVQKGLTESLAGRFELIHVTHWLYTEMQEAFNFSLAEYIFFGGYPGAVSFKDDYSRWSSYIRDSLIETIISRDILLMTQVNKPALLRRLFDVGCAYSGQILSYQKIMGQLQDAGNTTTLAHYLSLLGGAGMLYGLSKFAGQAFRQRASSPKFIVGNTALLSVRHGLTMPEAMEHSEIWGRMVESTVGAHLLASSLGTGIDVMYWNEGNNEVDFILKKGDIIVAVEVKSSSASMAVKGLEIFNKKFLPKKTYLVGGSGFPLDEFLRIPIESLFI